MAAQQQALYESLLHSGTFRSVVSAAGRGNRTVAEEPLQLIGVLRLLCTHPFLAMAGKTGEAGGAAAAAGEEEEVVVPERALTQGAAGAVADYLREAGYLEAAQVGRAAASTVTVDTLCSLSGKCHFLMELLRSIQRAGDRVVVVSAFTCTLDLITRVCEHLGMGCMRLDGSTDAAKRQVRHPSARSHRPAGAATCSPPGAEPREPVQHASVPRVRVPALGQGGGSRAEPGSRQAASPRAACLTRARLRLRCTVQIGANRLIMVDLDWNPGASWPPPHRVGVGPRSVVTQHRPPAKPWTSRPWRACGETASGSTCTCTGSS